MKAYLFFVKAYPESKIRENPYRLHRGVFIPACVIDTDSETAERRLRAEITAKGWHPGESQLLRTIEDPETEVESPDKEFLEQFHASSDIWLSLLKKCLHSSSSKIEIAAFRSLGENHSLIEPVDI